MRVAVACRSVVAPVVAAAVVGFLIECAGNAHVGASCRRVSCGGGTVVAAAAVGFLIECAGNAHVGASCYRVSCGGGAVVAAAAVGS